MKVFLLFLVYFFVDVQGAGESHVTTSVQRNDPSILLTCAVPSQQEVSACKFRGPQGNVLVSTHGVGHDGYTFIGAGVNYESDPESHDCTLRITNPSASDMGIWRCALDTDTETYYGFLTVTETPEASIQPVLESNTHSFFEGETVTLSCSINAPLRYCYFRASGYNGSIYTVFPGMSSGNFEYAGAGLNAGECGIRFQTFHASDSGEWSCHAGLTDVTADELRTTVVAHVRARATARLYFNNANTLVVEAEAYNEAPIEYCRFVRINGHGFTSDNVPQGYTLENALRRGLCSLQVEDSGILNRHPWAVIVKLVGVAGEISMVTRDNLLTNPTTAAPTEGTTTEVTHFPNPVDSSHKGFHTEALFWVLIAIIIVISSGAAFLLIRQRKTARSNTSASPNSNGFARSWENDFKKDMQSPPQYAPESPENRV